MVDFNGTWKIDVSRSEMWSAEEQRYLPEEVGEEIITISIEDGVQDYEVLYGDDPVMRMGYTARFDDSEWVPYLVREIIPVDASQDLGESIEAFRARIKADHAGNERHFEVGKPYGMVRLVWVDDRTHYRFQRTETGEAQNVMMRRMAEDGQSYLSSLMDRDGVVFRTRWFLRA
jgi:hypothetical protein